MLVLGSVYLRRFFGMSHDSAPARAPRIYDGTTFQLLGRPELVSNGPTRFWKSEMDSSGIFDATDPGGFHGDSDILHRTHDKSIIPNVESASKKKLHQNSQTSRFDITNKSFFPSKIASIPVKHRTPKHSR